MAQHLSGPPSLTGQVAFITGGSGGMGRAIANAFQAAGARVIATDLGAHGDIGTGIEYRRDDVTSRADTDKVIDGVLADHGKADTRSHGIARSRPGRRLVRRGSPQGPQRGTHDASRRVATLSVELAIRLRAEGDQSSDWNVLARSK